MSGHVLTDRKLKNHMKRSPGSSKIAVATSIPPKLTRMNVGQSIGEEYQKLCIRSWIDCGFRILSVNDREEIPNLAAKYPEVRFIAADRNASAWTERKTPHIADLLLALNDAPEPVLGIINSDLVFEPAPSWQECLPSLVGENLIVGHRYDTASLLQGALRRLEYGIDYFFFDKALIGDALRHAMPFAMGLPSWDYWLCLAAAFDGRRLMQIDQLKVVHLDHDRAWSNENWNKFGQFLARFVIAECERVTRDLPECITAIEPACRAVAALPDEELAGNKAFHPRIREMAIIFNQWYPESVTRFESGTPSIFDGKTSSYDAAFDCPEALTPLNTFGRFESRVAAGHALSKAKYLLRAGNLEGAERELSAAVKETPDDFGVLLALGEVTFRSGNFQGAHIYLSKAAEQRPNSPYCFFGWADCFARCTGAKRRLRVFKEFC